MYREKIIKKADDVCFKSSVHNPFSSTKDQWSLYLLQLNTWLFYIGERMVLPTPYVENDSILWKSSVDYRDDQIMETRSFQSEHSSYMEALEYGIYAVLYDL